MLDLERNNSTMTISQAEEFVETINAELGRYPVLYMGRFGPTGDRKGLPSDILSKCDLMLPAYGDHAKDISAILPPGFKMSADPAQRGGGWLRMWQFTDGKIHGTVYPGLGPVDQSYAMGLDTLDTLAAWWGH